MKEEKNPPKFIENQVNLTSQLHLLEAKQQPRNALTTLR